MQIYKGIVTSYGSGNVDGSNNSTFVTREFIDIGEVHLRKVLLSQYLDDMIRKAYESGEEIQLSTYRLLGFRRTAVLAVKFANGQVRKEETLFTVVLHILFFFALAMVATLVFSIVLALLTDFGPFKMKGGTIFIIGLLAGIAYSGHGLMNYLKARSAF